MSDFLDVLTKRTAAEYFDSSASIPDSEIKELVEEASQAPSSFNIQHWRFIAVTDAEIRQRLKSATIESNQARVADAPVTFLVLGDLQGHTRLGNILDATVQAGLLSREVADVWMAMAIQMYGNPLAARDEAIRSASLAAMTLMLAAGNRGYLSCPIGFDPVRVNKILEISDRYVPVMMLAVGRPSLGNTARRPRLSVDDILAFNAFREF